jgi:hypothetical protein
MHNKSSADTLIDRVAEMDNRELDRLQAAIDHRRATLEKEKKQSTVSERREHRNGVLQLEGRAYRRKKDGELTDRAVLILPNNRRTGNEERPRCEDAPADRTRGSGRCHAYGLGRIPRQS